MDLIIKPTEKCNFACTFCSSTNLVTEKSQQLDLTYIKRFLQRFPNTRTIIVNGGDPLMVAPKYYWDLIEYLDANNLGARLSFTTNLWAFYKNPNQWLELFLNDRVGVNTSFNFGETRRITKSRNFDVDTFWNVSNLFLEKIGYRPDFISIINSDNVSTAIENVKLAKQMNVVCKLNYAMMSGNESKPFLRSTLYGIYLDIIDLKLHPWEYNSTELLRKSNLLSTTCPLNRDCDSSIRCLQPDGDYYSCGSFGDDKEYAIDFEVEMNQEKIETPLKNRLELFSLKSECVTCPLFELCNGCKKTIKDIKSSGLVESHCREMQSNMPQFLKILGQPHDFVDQSQL